MSAILRPVRSYANSRSPILDNDPKLVQLKCNGWSMRIGHEVRTSWLKESPSGFARHTLYKYLSYEES